MSGPMVTVITPTYEGADFVAETIESVLAQTHESIEHVLVDDGSTDATVAVVQRYVSRHPERVRLIQNAERLGPCHRRNQAIAAARGELVAWLDHDDLWAPEKTTRQIEALERSPGAVLAFSQFEEFDNATDATLSTSSLDADDLLPRLVAEGCFIASSTVLFRLDAMRARSPRLREAHPSFGDDYFLWLALLLDGHGVLVDDPLVRLRRHERNESARLGRENYHPFEIALLEDYARSFPDARARLGGSIQRGLCRCHLAAASDELAEGHSWRAVAHAMRALRHDPRTAAPFTARIGLSRIRGALRPGSTAQG